MNGLRAFSPTYFVCFNAFDLLAHGQTMLDWWNHWHTDLKREREATGQSISMDSTNLKREKQKDVFCFGSIALASTEKFSPFQAADILVYESWNEVWNAIVPNSPRRPIRESARFL
jgi:hypothetical protein